MRRVIRFGAVSAVAVLVALNIPVAAVAVGEPARPVLIAEVSPESSSSASEEFIELYNPNPSAIEVTGWKVEYRSASHAPDDAKGWSVKAILGCASAKASECDDLEFVSIGAGETLRLASFDQVDDTRPLSSGMATTGGQVRLMTQKDETQDLVGYGTATDYEGNAPTTAPKAGRSISRVHGVDGSFVDTDDNKADFMLAPDTARPPSQDNEGDTSTTYLGVELTEVFPDPASPQLDSSDEFIELYNPYDQPLDLTGYQLKTGSTWSHSYTIEDITLDPHGYVAVTSAQTHLSLSNSGSGVRLYDPNGRLIVGAPSYGKAQTGQSWVRDNDGQWVWSTTPTPGGANIVSVPAAETTATTGTSPAKKTSAKTTKAKTPSSASSKKKTSPSSKLTSAAKNAATLQTQHPGSGAGQDNRLGYMLLMGAGILAVGYMLFEYREEISSFVRRLLRLGRS